MRQGNGTTRNRIAKIKRERGNWHAKPHGNHKIRIQTRNEKPDSGMRNLNKNHDTGMQNRNGNRKLERETRK